MQRLQIERLTESTDLPSAQVLGRISDLAFICSRDGRRLLYINPRAADFIGWSCQEATQFAPWTSHLLSEASQAEFTRTIEHMQADQPESAVLQLQICNAGGGLLPISVHSLLYSDECILLLASYSISPDDAEEILRQTQARFRSIVDSLSINLVLKDLSGRRVYANRAYLERRNESLADIIGKLDTDLFPPDIAARFAQDDRQVIETGKVLYKFEENVDQHGERRWTEVIKGPLRDADNRISGIQILFWDATERKLTEQAYERERYLLHALLDNIPDSIYFKDQDSRFVRISRGMAKKFGLEDPQSAIGKTDADIFTEEHAAQARQDELHIMETEEPMVARVERETWPDMPDTWCSTTKLPLRDADGKIVGTFGISRDVTDMIKSEHLLREARDAADSANRAKSDFLANMSHEIRTPMNGIIGMAELLRNTQLNDAQRSFLEMIESSAQSLLRIINDILDFSKIEAGKLDLESSPFDLRKCVSHAAKSLAARAAEKSIELILELDNDVPDLLLGDAVRLRQVLVNLVGNAIKFTEDGEITVRVSVADGPPAASDYTLHFAVTDTGIGIPPEKQKNIFEAFSQADVTVTRKYGGTGLGLSISGQLVEMMDGRIWLESEVGVGSTFHFTAAFPPAEGSRNLHADALASNLKGMPVLLVDDNRISRETLRKALQRRGLKVVEAANAQEAHQQYLDTLIRGQTAQGTLIVDQVLGDSQGLQLITELHHLAPDQHPVTILLSTATHPIGEEQARAHQVDAVLQKPALQSEICFAIRRALGHEPSEAKQPQAAAAPTPAPSGMRFLLAEDGAVNRAVFVGLLEARGHHVTSVEDGQAAVDAWEDFSFDAIFMDVQMPVLDGLEATRIIRSREADSTERVPIIAITAAAMESDYARCMEAGMDDYLSKPIDFNQLDRLLAKLSEGKLAQAASKRAAAPAQPAPAERTASGAKASKLINLNAPLSKLKCNPEQQRQLVATLQREATQRLEELSQALENHDDKLLVRASHSLRSAAALFEATAVAKVSGTIENFARAGETSQAREHFAELRQSTTSMLSEIRSWLAEHPG